MFGRSRFHFDDLARKTFAFLEQYDFRYLHPYIGLVRYRTDDVSVDVFYERQSYEIGLEVCYDDKFYSLSELIRINDPAKADNFRNTVAINTKMVEEGLCRTAELLKIYGMRAIRGDKFFFSALEVQQLQWAKGYEEEVLADQLRPMADTAFRQGNYERAAALYERFRSSLRPSELRRLQIAQARRAS